MVARPMLDRHGINMSGENSEKLGAIAYAHFFLFYIYLACKKKKKPLE